jgi:hypothetical protein
VQTGVWQRFEPIMCCMLSYTIPQHVDSFALDREERQVSMYRPMGVCSDRYSTRVCGSAFASSHGVFTSIEMSMGF